MLSGADYCELFVRLEGIILHNLCLSRRWVVWQVGGCIGRLCSGVAVRSDHTLRMKFTIRIIELLELRREYCD